MSRLFNPHYSQCQIYKLIINDDCYYIGTTTQSLHQRKNNHMMEFLWTKPCSEIENYVKSLGIEINRENLDKLFKIELLQNFECQNKKEMLAKKDEHLKKYQGDKKCLNNETFIRKIKQEKENLLKRREKERKDYHENKEKYQEIKKKYRETHKEKIQEKSKKYYDENKEKIAEKHNEKINCPCGSIIIRNQKARHEQTEKHQEWITNNTNETEEQRQARLEQNKKYHEDRRIKRRQYDEERKVRNQD